MSSTDLPLDNWVVADLSTGIAGGYCTKILADGGADVVKVESPDGDPLRGWSASGAAIARGADGALFQFLAASKRSVVADVSDRHAVHDLLDRADVAIWTPGSPLTDRADLAPGAILRDHPHLTLTAITPFGLEGPWCDRAATELTLQAWSGGIIGLGRGDPERAPVFVGGQVGLWLAGAFAATGTLASRRNRGTEDPGELVDVSMLEVISLCLTYYPVTYVDGTGRPFRRQRAIVTPGVAAARDGLVAVGVGTGQHWLDFCVMVGHPEWMEDPTLFRDRGRLAPEIDAWFAERTVDEIRDLATAFRLPNAPVADGAALATMDHVVARGSFVRHPTGGFRQPVPPYRLRPASLRSPEPAPRLGEHTDGWDLPPQLARASSSVPLARPFSDLRVLDLTAFWAGPSCTHALAMLGADVIHIESTSRLDGTRMLGAALTEPQWWERSPIFSVLNTNKRSLTLDLGRERGKDLLRQLIATADVIVENFTPRVLEQLGLTYDLARSIRPDVILVRMPGFGLDGPWRDNAAFAYTIEDAGGLTWLTGHADALPVEPYCVGDPTAGVHALSGLLLALEHRRRTGEGVLVEAAMVDAALNVSAEQVIEHSAYGVRLERDGNRGPTAAPQNLYRTADLDDRGGRDRWVAVAVETDAQWHALVAALGHPGWASDPALATAAGRTRGHDLIDERLAAWCAARPGDEIVDLLGAAGVPVAPVCQPHEQGDLAQLRARGFFEVVEHPVLGAARHSTLPMRFSHGPARCHRRPAPRLGEHNHELLAGLGLTDEEISMLESDGVIGRAPADAGTTMVPSARPS